MQSPFDRAAQAPSNKPLSSTQRSTQLSRLDSWTTSGSVGISYSGKTDIGTFVWHQKGLAYDFRTYGPLNVASIRIEGQPGRATLWKNAHTSRTAVTPEVLMRQELGWFLPLSNLRFWSRGLAAPGVVGQQRYDEFGHLQVLQQQGWLINYQRYQAVGNIDLPRNVVMTHRDLRVKIIFKEW
jgi:outer membrane lipoprotein LolB